MSTAEKLLTISFVVNISVGLFHFLPRIIVILLHKLRERFGCAEQLLNLNEEKPWILGKFFVDQLSSVVLTILAIIIIPVSGIIFTPFIGMPLSVQLAIATDIGHYTYKLAQDFCLRAHQPSFRINALHHIISIITLAVFLAFEQNGLNCLVGLLFEGNLVFFGVSHLLKALHIESYNLAYGMNKYAGFAATVLCRGILPLLFLVLSLIFGNPFSMDYISIAFYFLSDIFFLILNIWFMKVSFDSVRKFRNERKKHVFISDLMPGDNESQISADSADKSQIFPRNNLRYLTPCANANLNAETTDGRISNLHRNRDTMTNIREILFPVLPNNERPAASLNHSIASRNSTDSKGSSTAIDPDFIAQQSPRVYQGHFRDESSYPENISLGSVRAPHDGEDSLDNAPALQAGPTAAQGTALPSTKRLYSPQTGPLTNGAAKRNLSDSSLSDKTSVTSSSSKSSQGNFPGGVYVQTITHTALPLPPYVPNWKNTNNLTTEITTRTESKTSSESVDSQSRTSEKLGDSKNTNSNKDDNSS